MDIEVKEEEEIPQLLPNDKNILGKRKRKISESDI